MSFCSKVRISLRNLLIKVDKLIVDKANIAISVVEQLKGIVDMPVLDKITWLTPTIRDEQILKQVRDAISATLVELRLIDSCSELPNDEERLNCFIKVLAGMPERIKEGIYLKFASTILKRLDGNRERTAYYDLLIQAIYTSTKNKN